MCARPVSGCIALKQPRILFVSPRVPDPPNSGTNIRIRHLMNGLARVGHVHWVGYGWPKSLKQFGQSSEDRGNWWESCSSVTLVPHPEWPEMDSRTYERRLRTCLFRADPLLFASYPIRPLWYFVADAAKQVDLVWIEQLPTAHRLDFLGHKAIVDLNDLEAVKLGRQADLEEPSLARWAMRREQRRLRHVERRVLDRFAAVAVCSTADQSLVDGPRDRVWVLPNGFDDALLERPPSVRRPSGLIFVGTMEYAPNEDAAVHFCRDIFPLVRQRLPHATLTIVGRSPGARVRALSTQDGIDVLPDVPEVAPLVQEAALSVVPLRVGGGTRLKILESLALGTPVVSTAVGAEGLDLRTGEDLLIADRPDEFAEAVVSVLTDSALRERLSASGRSRVAERYRWSAIEADVGERIGAWLAKRAETQ